MCGKMVSLVTATLTFDLSCRYAKLWEVCPNANIWISCEAKSKLLCERNIMAAREIPLQCRVKCYFIVTLFEHVRGISQGKHMCEISSKQRYTAARVVTSYHAYVWFLFSFLVTVTLTLAHLCPYLNLSKECMPTCLWSLSFVKIRKEIWLQQHTC